jgi:raffinose/stachyose/melibiose transport system permease protein
MKGHVKGHSMTATLPRAARRSAPRPASLPPVERRRRLDVHRSLTTVVVMLIVAVQVYPLVWLFLTALRTPADFASGNLFALPAEITLDNFARALSTGNLGLNILNSFVVTMGANVLIVVLGTMAAYALTVLGFRFSGAVRAVFLLGIIVPVQIALVPLFIDYAQVGLLDTYASMIIPLAGFALPMSVYLFSSFYSYIPGELYEAATLDGAGPYRIFTQITFPMSLNTIITVVMVNAIFIWNDFIFANTFVLSDGLRTIPLGLQNYIGAMGNVDWTATFAAVCITITPLLLVFLVLNKAMIQGLESGATKG